MVKSQVSRVMFLIPEHLLNKSFNTAAVTTGGFLGWFDDSFTFCKVGGILS